MSAKSPLAVAIVMDPRFGERLRALSARQHVWAIDSPHNRVVAEEVWETAPGSSERGITLFRSALTDPPEQSCAEIVGTVEEHHGTYSHDPPVTILEIYGASAVGALREVLSEYGFTSIAETPEGFRASARPAINDR